MAKVSGQTHTQKQLNNYENQHNPNNSAYRANSNNHPIQLNPNNQNYKNGKSEKQEKRITLTSQPTNQDWLSL